MATTSGAQRSTRVLHRSVPLLLLGALLCAIIIAIHVIDQGGLTGLADPPYKGYLYYTLEIGAAICAILLLTRRAALMGWVIALGVAVGPIVGYIASRSIGLPHYTDDIGNWTEPLGLAALSAEGLLLITTLVALAAARRARRST
jgi:MFS family permease